jgi:hypothetical protein
VHNNPFGDQRGLELNHTHWPRALLEMPLDSTLRCGLARLGYHWYILMQLSCMSQEPTPAVDVQRAHPILYAIHRNQKPWRVFMPRWLKRILSRRAARAQAARQPRVMYPQLPQVPPPAGKSHVKSEITDPYKLYDLEARHRRERDGAPERQLEVPVEEP